MQQPHIFFVDDDPIILKLIKMFLRKSNYEIETFLTADRLLDALDNGNIPDLIISDITLGGLLNGFELLQHVHEKYPKVRYAYCSAYITLDMAVEINGVKNTSSVERFPYYPKPIEMPRFQEFIESALSDEIRLSETGS